MRSFFILPNKGSNFFQHNIYSTGITFKLFFLHFLPSIRILNSKAKRRNLIAKPV